jgi:hypothetical protein
MTASNTTIVGILGAHDSTNSPHDGVTFTQVIRLLDPSGEDERLYLLSTNKPSAAAMSSSSSSLSSSSLNRDAQVYELTHVLSDDDDHDVSGGGTGYTSMFVGNHVVNKPLHTFTPVDPLFWVLSKFDPPQQQSSQNEPQPQPQQQQARWQPLNQIVASLNLALPEPLVEELSRPRTSASGQKFRQMDHLFKRMSIGGGSADVDETSEDDEVFYKFCPDRALRWLTQKQQRVEGVMKSIAIERKQQGDGIGGDPSSGGGTAFDSGFCFSEDDPTDVENRGMADANANNGADGDNANGAKTTAKPATDPTMLDSAVMQRVKDESVQVVCQYVTPVWRDALLRSMDLARSSLEGKAASPPSKSQAGGAKSSGMPTPHLSIEEQLLGAGVVGAASLASKKQPTLSNKKSKIKPSDSKGMKKMTSFFTKK